MCRLGLKAAVPLFSISDVNTISLLVFALGLVNASSAYAVLERQFSDLEQVRCRKCQVFTLMLDFIAGTLIKISGATERDREYHLS